jgi:hypothetical protein
MGAIGGMGYASALNCDSAGDAWGLIDTVFGIALLLLAS